MKGIVTAGPKPTYPAWSNQCEHTWGISLSEAFQRLAGEYTTVGVMRNLADNLPLGTSDAVRTQVWKRYSAVVRVQRCSFADRVVKDHYFTTGIRFPFSEKPVREEIPPELYLDARIFQDKNIVKAKGPHNESVTYVDVRVSTRFWHNPSYDHVTMRHLEFRLNRTQAAIVCYLHKAALAGEREGVYVKRLLHEVGKRSNDLGDYFKDKPLWRFLIVKTYPGRYRLDMYGF